MSEREGVVVGVLLCKDVRGSARPGCICAAGGGSGENKSEAEVGGKVGGKKNLVIGSVEDHIVTICTFFSNQIII
jgi:hypothetical protein